MKITIEINPKESPIDSIDIFEMLAGDERSVKYSNGKVMLFSAAAIRDKNYGKPIDIEIEVVEASKSKKAS